ncbi:monovalent cation/H(+) antiporter subunit G [Agrobacterium vitis]|uniref:Na+/H+ antiporter subunit G n=1 Tax=Agrobacterium vitis TaxID=373 RepID=A0AAE4WHG1_AGRVI|nr:monovalent cation/H(+) antiporter subunit G [Agrobacterium vitis]MCF1500403.1 monovalent cation/H(+) antiporter subunit G [Allorhizobium sp. Av2]MCM2442697.1 monovalent cation/H(+) antiporter subunit G [Agrobacterium vitis]MUZ60344.1 Na+/H+ antiporter subunit G [Agrobacterium vitis]MVA68419.1 Na+/H+ antiporter subunit G [Agrobacterium vitis]MVA88849.1 Na+/H+ antiporter subunit G [Agrobacterium vitis]
MEIAAAILTSVLILGGSFFAVIAAIGLNRLPDLFTRMHAASKAGTVGSGLLLLAIGVNSGDLSVFARAFCGFFFFVLTAPVSAHLLAKAARHVGYPLAQATVLDEMSNGIGNGKKDLVNKL